MPEFVVIADIYIEAEDEEAAKKLVTQIEVAFISLPFDVSVQLGELEDV